MSELDWSQLRAAEVFPLPRASDIRWTSDAWEVDIAVVLETTDGGYRSVPVFTHHQPYPAGTALSPADAERARETALSAFAVRLRTLLS